MRIPKGGTPLPPPQVRAIGEHTEFNKTTEAQSLQRKATPFFMRKRGENSIRKWKMIHRLQFIELTLKLGIRNEKCEIGFY